MIGQRLGRFTASPEFVYDTQQRPALKSALWDQIVVISTEVNFGDTHTIEYAAFSPLFDELKEEDWDIPEYTIEITQYADADPEFDVRAIRKVKG